MAKLIGKHLLIYVLTCILASFITPLSLGIWHEELYLIIFIFAMLVTIITTLLPYIISMILISITRVYLSYKLLSYIMMGILCSLVGAVLTKQFFVLFLNGTICGLFYYYMDGKLSFKNKKTNYSPGNNILDSRIIRVPAKLLLALLLLYSVYEIYMRTRPAYVVGMGGAWKEKVPQKIVFFRDCDSYEKFIHSIAKPMFLPSDACPWRKVDITKPAEIKLGEDIYRIPRDYLWQNRKTPNGERQSIHLMMKYPTMEPGLLGQHEDGYTASTGPYHINVRVAKSRRKGSLAEKSRESYYHKASISSCVYRNKSEFCPKKGEYLKELDLTNVSPESVADDIFIKGDPYDPTYWVRCSTFGKVVTNPGCETEIYLADDNIVISLTFRRKWLFNDQKDVIKKVIKKVKELKIN